LAAGEKGPLLGIPLIHKDIFCTDGVRTSCGSRMLDNFVAPYDATVVARLKAAGAVMLGKANMDEFAMGSSNETSYYGPVKNPWDTAKVPGGSSGGSAAAMAARLAPFTTGTDTGGSIRQPAALTGHRRQTDLWSGVALRHDRLRLEPGSGRRVCPLGGRCGAGAAGHGGFRSLDSTSVDAPVPDYSAMLGAPAEGPENRLVAGVLRGLEARNAALIHDALKVYTSPGGETVEVSLPHLPMSVPTYYVVAPAECFLEPVALRRRALRLPLRGSQGLGGSVQALARRGLRSRGQATHHDGHLCVVRRVLRCLLFEGAESAPPHHRRFSCGVREGGSAHRPTTPTPAFDIGAKIDDPVTMYLNDIYTIGANLAGLPGLSMPCGYVDNLPMGLQLIGPHFSEGKLLNAAHQFQQATEWHKHAPRGYE
jgi:aspartyl-tRNA(Asn)/glutamyl-tRNA(Gln) amidotransferase subunit A